MSQGADNPTVEPQIAGSILLIPVDQIELGDRLRRVDPLWAEAIGRLMMANGQETPIAVCKLPGRKTWRLVTGAHRLTGARMAGLPAIRAIEVGSDTIERKLREIGENIWRRDLDPLDRATFVGEMHDLLKAKAGIRPDQSAQSLAAQARWKDASKSIQGEASDASDIVSHAYGFTAEIAERLRLSKRSIERDLVLRCRFTPDELSDLRDAGHAITRNGTQLLALAKLEQGERADAIRLILADEAKSVAEAVATIRKRPKPNPRDKRINAFLRSFSAMPPEDKRAALTRLASELGSKQADHLIDALQKARGQ
ncbi:ParB/RepB/Spo0J family partition protein [Sphingomonas sp. SRS2]|uniref:ParB/RepB/Spo0J family partition protein n=1 Tax=Sphingomonas sp. SRS2 TaxID=133190 RepID=UPI000698E2E9|nr:ParB/RepB/Spo0J family partition protein [Sphingomonas sp. SRS2]